MLGGGGRLGMLFFCELYVIRDELALLGRTAHHPRSWASTSYNYNRSWASTSYKYNYQLPATSYQPHAACSGGHLPLPIDYRRQRTRSGTPSPSARCCHLLTAKLRTRHEAKCVRSRRVSSLLLLLLLLFLVRLEEIYGSRLISDQGRAPLSRLHSR